MHHVLLLLLSGVFPPISGEIKVVDLTWELGPNSVFWPNGPPFIFKILFRQQLPHAWYEVNSFSTAEHASTHLDAPAHFSKGSWRMHEIPPERLIGPGVVIDVRSKVKTDQDYRLSLDDVMVYEREYGRIPKGAIVFMNSGWSERYPDRRRVFNTDQPEEPSSFRYPGFHEEAVAWLIANRNIGMVGVDTPSVDYGRTKTFPVHVEIGNNNVMGLENVANLDSIPPKGATIFLGAIKLFDGSGGPVRILATFDQEQTENQKSEL